MRNTEKDKYWREMIRKQGELRHFGSMAIRKSSKGDLASAQEVDLLFRVALSGGMMTPGQERTLNDRRSYGIRVTDDGKEEVDRMYYYYLDPLYTLREQMTSDDFEKLFRLIEAANTILSNANSK